MATMIKREKTAGIPDIITLVVDGVLKREEAIAVFRQEYSAKKRSADLYVPGVSLEVVRDRDFDYCIMRCWYSYEQQTIMLDIRGKKSFKHHTLKGYLLARRRKARVRAVREEAWERQAREAKGNED